MSIETVVKDFIANDDNVNFMNGIKDEIYSKLSDNEEYAKIASEFSKYSDEYDADEDSFKKIDDIVNAEVEPPKDDEVEPPKDSETPPKDD